MVSGHNVYCLHCLNTPYLSFCLQTLHSRDAAEASSTLRFTLLRDRKSHQKKCIGFYLKCQGTYTLLCCLSLSYFGKTCISLPCPFLLWQAGTNLCVLFPVLTAVPVPEVSPQRSQTSLTKPASQSISISPSTQLCFIHITAILWCVTNAPSALSPAALWKIQSTLQHIWST